MTDIKYDLEVEAVFEEVKEKPKTKRASKKTVKRNDKVEIKTEEVQAVSHTTVYNIVVPFEDYKDMLDEYKVIDGKIVYRTYSNKSLAETIKNNLIQAGIYAVIEPK